MAASSNASSSSVDNCTFPGGPLASCLEPWFIVASVIIAISCLLGIPSNLTVIVRLSRHLHGSSMTKRLFFNLALSDLLCLLCLPTGVVIFFKGPTLPQGACQFVFYFFFFCITSDTNILVLISFQRYCQILHPKTWEKLGRTWQRFLLFSVWMLAALVALPVVFSLTEWEPNGDADKNACRNRRISVNLQLVYIVYIVFSHAVLLCFYLLLVRGLKRAQLPGKKKVRVNKLFVRIITVFLAVSFFPLVLRVLYVAAVFADAEELIRVCKMLTFMECFYFFHHCLNPFLYFFSSRHHRQDSRTKKKHFFDDNL